MSIAGLPATAWEGDECGHLLTFVLPAVSGCDLKCGFCFISQRDEIASERLMPADFVSFIRQAAATMNVLGISLQGYEPLLPGTLPYTLDILRVGRELGIPVSIVTNGTHLVEAMPALKDCPPAKIGVSLDAAAPVRHDRIRGVTGAWERTVEGLRQYRRTVEDAEERLAVLSIYMPGRRTYLDGMPQLLNSLDLREWVLNPLVTLEKSQWAYASKRTKLVEDLTELWDHAIRAGIDFKVDDELGILKSAFPAAEQGMIAPLPIRSMPDGVVLSRLSPGGELSVGLEIWRPLSQKTRHWRPHTDDVAGLLANSNGGNAQRAMAA